MIRRTLLALAILSAPAWGQAPGPTPTPDPVKPQPVASVRVPTGLLYAGDLIQLDGSACVGDLVDCEVISPPDLTTFDWFPERKTLVFANRKAGVYVFRFEAESIIDGKIAKAKQRVVVTTIDASPSPGPAPEPVTPVTPPAGVVTGHLHVTLFFDVNDPSVTPFRASKGFGASLARLDCDWYMLATTAPAAQPFNAELASDGSPVVLVQDAASRLLKGADGKTLALRPKSPADLLAQIQALRGVK